MDEGKQTGLSETKRCPYCAEEILSAAVVCKHCRRDLPKPVAPPPPPAVTPMKLMWFLIGVVVLWGIFGLMYWSPQKQLARAPSPPKRELSVDARFTGSQLRLQNTGRDDWTNVMVEINDGFKINIPALNGGVTTQIEGMQFANSEGTRFNPYTMKPLTLYIRATVNGQTVSYGGKWPN